MQSALEGVAENEEIVRLPQRTSVARQIDADTSSPHKKAASIATKIQEFGEALSRLPHFAGGL